MTAYNNFGTTFSRVLEMFPQVVVNDFDGQEAIDHELSLAAKQVSAALTKTVFQQLTEPDLELIVRRATAGQSTAQLGLFPVVANTIRIWRVNAGAIADPLYLAKPMAGGAELTGYSINLSTGAITGLGSLNADDQIYASYRVDVGAAGFSIPSLGEVVALGAAVALGPKIYARGTDAFQLVDDMRARWEKMLDLIISGRWIPDELRLMRWWEELEPTAGGISTINMPRG